MSVPDSRAWKAPEHAQEQRAIRNRDIALGVLAGVLRGWLRGPKARRARLFSNLWIELKCYAAPRVRSIPLSRIKGIDRIRVHGPVAYHSPLVVTALATLLQAETIFEFGPDTAETSWLLAHNLPDANVFWLDDGLPPPRKTALEENVYRLFGDARTTERPETARIRRISGDAESFDFLPYSGTADLVYVEASKRYRHLRSDTEAAFGLLSELGCIIWDGYSGDPAVWSYLNRLAPELDRPIFHIRGTRLAMYSRWDVVVPELA